MKTLDDLMDLNDQLAALAEAGVPIDIGLGEVESDTAGSLEKIDAAIARRVARGESLEEAIESGDDGIPDAYRSMVLRGFRGGDVNAALEEASQLAESVDDSRHVVRSAFAYPIIVCTLAYLGMIGFCIFFIPTLESTYDNLRIEPGSGLRLLLLVRDTLPFWVAIPPVVLLILVAWNHRTQSKDPFFAGQREITLPWQRGQQGAVVLRKFAMFADTLAALTERNVPLDDGLLIASGACHSASLKESANAISASIKQGQVPRSGDPAAMQFPPFLRWALLESEETVGRGRALRMAADIYLRASERRAERLRIVAPIVTCAIIGGGVTLLYGLALFVPVVQMLSALAQ